MAKGQRKETNKIIDQTRIRDQAISQDELEHTRALRNEAQGRLNESYTGASGVYNNLAGGGLSPEELARLRAAMEGTVSAAGGGGPGFAAYQTDWGRYAPIEERLRGALSGGTTDTARLRAPQGVYNEMMQTGGYNPQQLYSMGNDLGVMQGIGYTGGLDTNAMERMRGGGVFDEFSATGGLNDRDKMLLRDRATSPIAASLDSTRREINRLGRVQGGNSGARIAALAHADRASAQSASEASRAAELDVLDRVNQGRQWGATNLASSEGNLQGLRTGNMMNALNSAMQFQQGLGSDIANRRLQAGNMLGASEMDIQNMLQSEGRWGAEGLGQYLQMQDAEKRDALNAQNAASASAYGNAQRQAGMNLDNEWDLINFQNQNRMAGGQGLAGLYGANADQVMGYSGMMGQNRQIDQSGNATNIDQRMQNNPSFMQEWGPMMGGALGMASSFFMPGASGLPRNRLPAPPGSGGWSYAP